MRLIKKVLGIGTLAVLAGCYSGTTPEPVARHYYLDLNGDNQKELITAIHNTKKLSRKYDIIVRFSNPDGNYSDPKLLIQFKSPVKINFIDLDNDGDLDLTYIERKNDRNQKTFILKNDGKGKFSYPQ